MDELNDTWSDMRRRHLWKNCGFTHNNPQPGNERWLLWCYRCHQSRHVSYQSQPATDGWSWGCPRVPWRYRLRLWLRGRRLPDWSVNGSPPWMVS